MKNEMENSYTQKITPFHSNFKESPGILPLDSDLDKSEAEEDEEFSDVGMVSYSGDDKPHPAVRFESLRTKKPRARKWIARRGKARGRGRGMVSALGFLW